MWSSLLAVALGGAVGSVGRYVLGILMTFLWGSALFPFGTALINIGGSFVLGFVFVRFPAPSPLWLLVGVGGMGGFTTFSSFSVETMRLVQEGQVTRAMVYVGISVVLSIGAAAVGMVVAK